MSPRLLSVFAVLSAASCAAQTPAPQEPMPTFGTTVVMSSGLLGDIYFIKPSTIQLPNFEKLMPVGSVYTLSLNIPLREFTEGFPGVTERFEWFAIDYNGRFWIQEPGKYNFILMSDDGSKLYVDGKTVIDNDGVHSSISVTGSVKLATGMHRIRISYFQGPGAYLALMLGLARPGEQWHTFNMDHFLPPADHSDWK